MKLIQGTLLSFFMGLTLLACGQQTNRSSRDMKPAVANTASLSGLSVATFASGCFWCVEGVFESVKGVKEAVSGYAGGTEANPTYEQVSAHVTSHAETVQVYYDSTQVSYATLLKVYFASQDPTQVMGQGPDHGASYRSIIFYRNAAEKMQAQNYIASIQKDFKKPIAAELEPFTKFWNAEGYHQNYIVNNPGVSYVQFESIPRIKRFQKKFPDLIKSDRKL
ncbi:MAG: peptide-methionine (S)-S-oxide reductase MsrA [Ferruginibacter sp.]